jgi:hypothetical protein
MRRTLVILVAVLCVGTAAAVTASGRLPVRGCRIRSVDKAASEAANKRILGTVPLMPGATLISTYSIGQRSSHSCLPTENGPPYSAFTTYVNYEVATEPTRRRRFAGTRRCCRAAVGTPSSIAAGSFR